MSNENSSRTVINLVSDPEHENKEILNITQYIFSLYLKALKDDVLRSFLEENYSPYYISSTTNKGGYDSWYTEMGIAHSEQDPLKYIFTNPFKKPDDTYLNGKYNFIYFNGQAFPHCCGASIMWGFGIGTSHNIYSDIWNVVAGINKSVVPMIDTLIAHYARKVMNANHIVFMTADGAYRAQVGYFSRSKKWKNAGINNCINKNSGNLLRTWTFDATREHDRKMQAQAWKRRFGRGMFTRYLSHKD